ncbi:methyltransferase domain-containing protein [Fulvivirga sedimenti]|uniref:Methyltransferase domain-containing protein n=1 Tax=Fulvivirga sedimenti TaxID=2879465 RepID=A0A9X1HVZ7_9BACT|nr:methyltransferase domain-containing protein [Fulvivirga sedimenti]MCA6078400.1 methyltransferase domain-containing protein [Fulvivirga sedimenti]
MSNFLRKRSNEIELMDDLQSSGPVIDQTLKELAVINQLLGGNYVTLLGLDSFTNQDEPLHIIDIGCGGGDMMMQICDWATKQGIDIRITGVDANPNIIEYARRNTENYPQIDYLACDIFSEEFKALTCDVVTATLFTHHFSDNELIRLFSQLKGQARKGMVINDLHRHWFAYHSIKLLTRVFSKSKMVRNDAAVSVKRAFHKNELATILYKSGIHGFDLSWHWAFRWKVVATWDH